MSEEESSYQFPNKYRIASSLVFVGALAVFGLLILSFVAPEEALSLDQAGSIDDFYTTVEQHQQVALVGIVLDTIFITGYIALFCGLWLVIRDLGDIIAQVALILGLLVGLGDIVENAMLFVLILGIPNGWTPEPSIFNIMWTTNLFIDITSYIAAIFYGMQFVLFFRSQRIKLSIGLLFLGYALVGFLTLIYPSFFLVRTVLFVVGLGVGATMLYTEHELSDEELMQILQRSPEKTDYIR